MIAHLLLETTPHVVNGWDVLVLLIQTAGLLLLFWLFLRS